jgi:hypothetical protein
VGELDELQVDELTRLLAAPAATGRRSDA